MADDRLERVRTRLNASPELEEAVRRAVAEGKVPEAAAAVIPSGAADSAAHDRERLERVVPSDALEAIVQRVGRAPLLVRNNTVELEPLVDFPPGTDTLIKKVEPDVRSVGRVEFLNHSMSWGGTGWVIDDDGTGRVVATNRHVAKLVAWRAAGGRGVFLRSPLSGARCGMNLDFKEEAGSLPADARPVSVTEILYLADDAAPDVALLRIAGENLPSVLPLAEREAVVGDLVALIGYPAFDSRNNVDDQARYFRDLYDVKRFAPGKVMQALSGRTMLSHDCTSLGGNSGSPLVDLQTGKVVGLHFAGVYGLANSAVGLRTLQDLLTGRTPRVIGSPISTGPDGQSEARTDGVHSAEELTGRRGYTPEFLGEGLLAPWPGLPAAVETDLARPTDAEPERPFELRYTHFGVRFSTSRRQPLMTAVNIDGRHSVRIKRGNDRWFADARIPLETQLGQADYDDPEIDRGHMVRREDPNWDPAGAPGAASVLAEQADQDTFHYTNAAPQHSTMNQGKQLWQGLENYILDSARTHGFKACVFTGQVVREDDPEIKPGVQTPREFWKLVAMIDADSDALHATAYLLSQGDLIRDLLEKRERTEAVEGFVLGTYRTFQIAIRDLADGTGYDFSAYLAADPLGRTDPGREAAADAAPIFVSLESLADVVT